jgi:hypothetical protein
MEEVVQRLERVASRLEAVQVSTGSTMIQL